MVLCLVSDMISWCIWLGRRFLPPPLSFCLFKATIGLRCVDFYTRWGWDDVVGIPTVTGWSVRASKPGGDEKFFSISLHTGPGAHHPPLQWFPDMALATQPRLEYSHTSAIYHLQDVPSGEIYSRYLWFYDTRRLASITLRARYPTVCRTSACTSQIPQRVSIIKTIHCDRS